MLIARDHAAQCIRERRERTERLWVRFRILMARDGRPCPEQPTSIEGVTQTIRSHLVRGLPSGWWWDSAVEYTEITDRKGPPVPFPLLLNEPEPVSAIAGSFPKIDALANRAATGQELFHVGDGPGVMVQRVPNTAGDY